MDAHSEEAALLHSIDCAQGSLRYHEAGARRDQDRINTLTARLEHIRATRN